MNIPVGAILSVAAWGQLAQCHGQTDTSGDPLNGAVTVEFLSVGTGGVGTPLPGGPWVVEVQEWNSDTWTEVHRFDEVDHFSPGLETGTGTPIGTQFVGSAELRVTTGDGRQCSVALDGEGWAGTPPTPPSVFWGRIWLDAHYGPVGSMHYQCSLSQRGRVPNPPDTYVRCGGSGVAGPMVILDCHRVTSIP